MFYWSLVIMSWSLACKLSTQYSKAAQYGRYGRFTAVQGVSTVQPDTRTRLRENYVLAKWSTRAKNTPETDPSVPIRQKHMTGILARTWHTGGQTDEIRHTCVVVHPLPRSPAPAPAAHPAHQPTRLLRSLSNRECYE